MDVHLPMQSVPIIAEVVCSNPAQARYTHTTLCDSWPVAYFLRCSLRYSVKGPSRSGVQQFSLGDFFISLWSRHCRDRMEVRFTTDYCICEQGISLLTL
jgi:hypothetical protein